jgi:GcrA cell cycle regulator
MDATQSPVNETHLERFRSCPKWSDENTQKLIAWAKEGITYGKIAKALGLSRNAVIGKANRLKLKPRTCGGWQVASGNQNVRKRRRRECCPVINDALVQELRDTLILPSDPPPHERIAFLDLEPHQCRWPVGDDWCGRQKADHRYCAPHIARADR